MQNEEMKQSSVPMEEGHVPVFKKEFDREYWVPDLIKEDYSNSKNRERSVYITINHCGNSHMMRFKQYCRCAACSGSKTPVIIQSAVCAICEGIKILTPKEARTEMPPIPPRPRVQATQPQPALARA